MKGRRTSFQRFGSMVGVQGSALNKWTRGTEVRRDMDTAVSSSPPEDKSDGKGIYNLTLTNDNDLNYSVSDADMGEEVYGCISSGYTKNKTSPNIEHSSDIAINNRRERKDYPSGKDHFSESGRIWTGGDKKAQVESACIPQESVPLVANSKFGIKYWNNSDEKLIEVPKGAGFTSGALVRPIAFSGKATEPPDGAMVFTGYFGALYACKLSDVPIKTAHAILNRCKEISLTGSADIKLTRTSKECDGPNTSTKEWTSESGPSGCPPGTCKDTSGSITITCASTKKTTELKLSGDIDMTAYRYKQLSDIWSVPKTLDLSGNYFSGSFEKSAFLRKVSSTFCDPSSESISVKIPNPTIETIAEFEKQTKLSSGCLVYPETNASILLATQEENLKTSDDLGLENCSTSETSYTLESHPLSNYYSYNYFLPDVYAGGAKKVIDFTIDSSICPLFVSGPSLRCDFNGIGWDYTKIGSEGPEDLYTDDCFPQGQNFHDWKIEWKSTGIKKTIESGECEVGLLGLGRYDRTGSSGCECDSSCASCTNDYGKLDLSCNCTPLCAPEYKYEPFETKPCNGEVPTGCDGVYAFALRIGKHVGVEAYPSIYKVAPVPLSTKSDTKTEDLTLFWNGYISDRLPYSGVGYTETDMEFPLVLNEESADQLVGKENSTHRWETKEVGTLTIKCDDWTTDVPIWTAFRIAKETTCTGSSSDSASNMIVRSVTGTPPTYCVGCDGADLQRCCDANGCSGIEGTGKCCVSEVCGIDDPCGYAYTTTNVGKECDANKSAPSCSGSCEVSTGEDCGCCGCVPEEDTYCDVICPPSKICAPYVETKSFVKLGCYGSAHEEDKYEAEVNLTLEFKLFTEME